MTEPKELRIELQPAGVAAPAKQVALMASQAVATSLRALDSDDCTEPQAWGGAFVFRFEGLDLAPDERRTAFRNWILAKGFQDLARGVRETLEEAFFFQEMVARAQPRMISMAALDAEMAAIRLAASKPNFPDLLKQVNRRLTSEIAFEAEFRSLQNVRNCLEHRGGLVAQRDLDPLTGRLILSFPRIKLFYMRDGEEVELTPGEAIDTHDPDVPLGKGMVDIFFKRVVRTREYTLGEPVVIESSDFFEIAMACLTFADDVASKLPTLPILAGVAER